MEKNKPFFNTNSTIKNKKINWRVSYYILVVIYFHPEKFIQLRLEDAASEALRERKRELFNLEMPRNKLIFQLIGKSEKGRLFVF